MPARVVPPPDFAAESTARLHATIAEFSEHADAQTAEMVRLTRTIKAQTDVMVVLVVAQLAIAVLASRP